MSGMLEGFHQVRLQELQRERVRAKLGGGSATEQQGGSAHFVPSLQAICADLLAQNFASLPEVDALREEEPALYDMVIARLPVVCPSLQGASAGGEGGQLPLRVAVARVSSELYWKRCCEARWSLGQLSQFARRRSDRLHKSRDMSDTLHNGTLHGSESGVTVDEAVAARRYSRTTGDTTQWKRLYLEHTLCDYLLSLTRRPDASPFATRGASAGAAPSLAGDKVGRACLLSDMAVAHTEEGGEEVVMISDEEIKAVAELCAVARDYVRHIDLPCQFVHFSLHDHLFARLPEVRELLLTYGVCNVGVGYDRRMRGFTNYDAASVRYLVRNYTPLQTLALPGNQLTTSQVKTICAGLVHSTTLRTFDLTSNALDDEAVAAVALLLCRSDFPLEQLLLRDNNTRGPGAAALADALTMNHTLRVLDVSQNRIPDGEDDDGEETAGAALVRAVAGHATLTELYAGSNLLGRRTREALCEVLPQLQTLTTLHLACNSQLGGTVEAAVRPTEDGEDGEAEEAAAEVGKAAARSGLLEALQSNTSLQHLDLRMCNIDSDELGKITALMRQRAQRARSAVLLEKERALRGM